MIKIGVGVPLTGMGAALGQEMAQAIEFAVYEVNTLATSDRNRIELSILDDTGGIAASSAHSPDAPNTGYLPVTAL
jgi:ABC-type branched-subunit amino acid transport system substrate-binding protein